MIEFNWFTLLLTIGVVQGLFLMLILVFHSTPTAGPNKYLVWLVGVIVLSLCLRIFYDNQLYLKYPHASEAGDFVMFSFGPLLLVYVRSLLFQNFTLSPKLIFHLIPLIVFGIAFGYLLTIDRITLISLQTEGGLIVYYIILLSTAIIQNAIYVLISIKDTLEYRRTYYTENSEDHCTGYLSSILFLMLLCLTIWTVAFCGSLVAGWDESIVNTSYQIAFIGLSILAYIIAFFAISKPQILSLNQQDKKEKYQHSSLNLEDIEGIRNRLEKSLGKEKLYMDPKLSLSKLAMAINTNQVHLSRVINESYNKNFFELVNEYRIKDFISKVLSNEYKNYTYLGIALESGFNTKATFNKAFKKVTSVTPREFFNNSNELLRALKQN